MLLSHHFHRYCRLVFAGAATATICFGRVEAIWLLEARQERKAAVVVDQLGGAVYYAWRLDERIELDSWRSARAPGWLIPGDACVDGVSLCYCSAEALDHKIACLRSFGRLRWLNLFRAGISDAALEHIAGHSRLEWLNLVGTPITDAGLRHLDPSAPLKRLNLRNTLVTDASVPQLARLKQLESLDLRGTRVSRGGLALLRKLLPAARIETDFDGNTSLSRWNLERGLRRDAILLASALADQTAPSITYILVRR